MAINPNIYVSSVFGKNTGTTDTSKADPPQAGNITLMTDVDVYDTLESAVAGAAPSDGDIIHFTDDHAASYALAADLILISSGSANGVGLKLVSVDNLNIENYKPGASEDNTAAFDFKSKFNISIAGVDIKGADEALKAVDNTILNMQDAVITNGGGSGDNCLRMATGGVLVVLTNVELASTGAAAEFLSISVGGKLIWNGGKVSGTMPGALFGGFGGSGGATALLNGVDLSLLNKPFFPDLGAGTSDVCLLRLTQCELHASVVIPTSANMGSAAQRFEMFGCDDSTGNKMYRFLIVDGTGEAKNNDSVYVTANLAWYGGTDKSSIAVKTDPMISHANPFTFIIPDEYVDLASTSTDKITVNLVTDAVLTDTDIAAFLVYPQKATAVIPLHITSGKTVGAGNYGVDPIAAGTTLPTSALGAADWTGEPASPNFYRLDMDTVGAAGQATVAQIRIEVYTDFTTAGKVLYIDSELEIGT